ncbi:glycosyltransferase [Raineyella sp. LH-20]|uniref:glycosyltransferase n=1 Tax=Raineyella sp. LH-20 TaxID=3081204 RepID=UPI002955B53C|nr:glycosyltransferase [Raineyella sp. LH-20]WOP19851.1 glycosyltransferase [Raineyella sp. LH-20]
MSEVPPKGESSSYAPLLSVVVPFYNVQDYIGACLESLRVQTLTDLEVILVDDGSRDGSLQVAEAYVARDPRFRLVRQENQGLGPARNTGTAHATGRYLTFVDSDDLVAPRAYSLLIGSLEATGSDLAGGNAYRFSAARGAYQSWTHEEPFATTRLATTIDAFPALMRDRMVWNKVYRRAFWDAEGLAFPAIRYEDYPVTLPAYLRARSVDVLADHVYYWRDRESGDSITQQTFRLDNVRDRVASALAVLDVLDRSADHAEVRTRVHAYFIDVDLVALAEALLAAPTDDLPALAALATGLADRLDPRADRLATRLARQIHRSVRSGDLATVRLLARRRGGAGVRQLVADLRTVPRLLVKLPAIARAVAPRTRPQHPLRRRLRSILVSAAWQRETLHLEIDSALRGRWAARVTPRAVLRLGTGSGEDLEVPAQVTPGSDGLRWNIDLGPEVLARLGGPAGLGGPADRGQITGGVLARGVLALRLRAGAFRWTGDVRYTPTSLPAASRLADGTLAGLGGPVADPAPDAGGRDLAVVRWADLPTVTSIRQDGEEFVLTVAGVPASGGQLVVARPDPTADVVAPVSVAPVGAAGVVGGSGERTVGEVRLSAAALLADDPADDPVTGVAERAVGLQLPEGPRVPVLLAGDGARGEAGDRVVELTVGWTGQLVVRQRRRTA